ncbi:MAG: ABC transporter permease [Gammaproteobacteria bacterium]|nr:ABC transporter permease [Gammaproteobacteria bacterium]
MIVWLTRHLQTLIGSLGDLSRNSFSSILSISVIGIALALPGAMFAALENIHKFTAEFEHGAKISLFLAPEVSIMQAKDLQQSLAQHGDIKYVEIITPDQAMEEFKLRSGLKDALNSLSENPLPVVLLVYPEDKVARSPEKLAGLINELGKLEPVELSQFDLEWIKRLTALLELATRAVWVIAIILGLGVFLVIGNTIRLAIVNRQEEIRIIKLIGGTDAFVRRSFLYSGMLQGLFGGLLALLVIFLLFSFISKPASSLSSMYGIRFALDPLQLLPSLILTGSGALLGWLSARITVGVYLRQFEPGKQQL